MTDKEHNSTDTDTHDDGLLLSSMLYRDRSYTPRSGKGGNAGWWALGLALIALLAAVVAIALPFVLDVDEPLAETEIDATRAAFADAVAEAVAPEIAEIQGQINNSEDSLQSQLQDLRETIDTIEDIGPLRDDITRLQNEIRELREALPPTPVVRDADTDSEVGETETSDEAASPSPTSEASGGNTETIATPADNTQVTSSLEVTVRSNSNIRSQPIYNSELVATVNSFTNLIALDKTTGLVITETVNDPDAQWLRVRLLDNDGIRIERLSFQGDFVDNPPSYGFVWIMNVQNQQDADNLAETPEQIISR